MTLAGLLLLQNRNENAGLLQKRLIIEDVCWTWNLRRKGEDNLKLNGSWGVWF